MLDLAIEKKIRLLLVIDGVDEALGGHFSARWFPRNAGSCLRLLVSARLEVGDRNALSCVTRLGWDSGVRVRPYDLRSLGLQGVSDLLLKAGAPVEPLASRSEAVERLYELTEGEPLLLRFYVEDLLGRVDNARHLEIGDLDNIKPGLSGYFADWVKRQGEVWISEGKGQIEIDRLHVYLAILACAYGPVTPKELGELAYRARGIEPGFRVEGALHPIRRFVISKASEAELAGYVLTHPKFGEFLRDEYLDGNAIEQTKDAFAAWGREVVRQLNNGELEPAKTPTYLLKYLGQHFEDVEAGAKEFMSLVEEGWLRSWELFEEGYRGFSQDVRRALVTIGRQHQKNLPARAWQLRCQLVLSSIAAVGSKAAGGLLVECVKNGVLTFSQALSRLQYRPNFDCAVTLAALAPQVPEVERREVLKQALRAAQAIEGDGRDRAEALAALAPQLPEAERREVLEQALQAAEAIENGPERVRALAALAPQLSEAECRQVLDEALQAAEAIEDREDRARALAALAPQLPDGLVGRALQAAEAIEYYLSRVEALTALVPQLPEAERREVLERALQAAEAIDNSRYSWYRARALAALAPQLPEGLVGRALLAAEAIEDGVNRVRALAALASRLPDAERREILAQALQAAEAMIEGGEDRVEALAALAPQLREAERREALEEALQAAEAIELELSRSEELVELAPQLPEGLLARALEAAEAFQDVNDGARVLVALVPQLPEGLVARALQAAEAIDDGWARARVLAALASRLPEGLVGRALQAAEAIEDGEDRTRVLVALASRLPEAERRAVLEQALQAAEAIDDGWARARVLAALASRLPEAERREVLDKALQVAEATKDHLARVRALVVLAPRLPEAERRAVLEQALQAVETTKDAAARAWALELLAPLLPEELVRRALEVAIATKDRLNHVRALAFLAPRLSEAERSKVLEQALQAAEAIEDSRRGDALWTLGPLLPEGLMGKALRAAEAIEGASLLVARLLVASAPRLPEAKRKKVLEQALLATESIEDGRDRARGLELLAPQLPEGLVGRALQAAQAIEGGEYRAWALGALALRMPEAGRRKVLEQALQAVETTKDAAARAWALELLAPQLPDGLVDRALQAAQAIERGEYRARALVALAPQLPEAERRKVLEQALQAAEAIEGGPNRARALAALAPLLPENLRVYVLDLLISWASRLARETLLECLPNFFSIISRLEGSIGLRDIKRAILDSGKWFP